jgi:hypothetical protein
MNITSSRLRATQEFPLKRTSQVATLERGDDTFSFGYTEYPPVWFGGASPFFGAIMNGIGALDADPHGRTDLVYESLGGALSNLAGSGLLISAFCNRSIATGLLGAALLGVSGAVAGHVMAEMP